MTLLEAADNAPVGAGAATSRQRAGFLVMAMLGVALVGVFGLAPVAAIHDASHDTRHALGLPCH